MSIEVLYNYSRVHKVMVLNHVLFVTEETDLISLNEVYRFYGHKIQSIEVVSASDFEQKLSLTHSLEAQQEKASDIIEAVGEEMSLKALFDDMPVTEDLLNSDNDAPIIRTINALLTQAVRDRASDIHIEPFEKNSSVRFRLDGQLVSIVQPRRSLHAPLVSRIKVMAKMDIAEKRLPQDGRIALRLGKKQVDVRVSTLPTVYGERVVIRLLDRETNFLTFDTLGLVGDAEKKVAGILSMPHGIFLVTGPTGSGKTTTLYAALTQFTHLGKKNIMTVEDPVEYDLPGVSQTNVNTRIGMSFAKALRSILRQDPDIVMIGEIRDTETAQIAVQASLTGHIVLATLHTNDSLSAVTRLRDMGIEPFLLAPSLRGVLAQRLLRRLCQACARPRVLGPALAQGLNLRETDTVFQAVGCEACRFTGYSGRVGVFEVLEIDSSMEELIHQHASEKELRELARSKGFCSLGDEALSLVSRGVTSPEEVLSLGRDVNYASL